MADNTSVPLGGYDFAKAPSAETEAVLGIRPEHIFVGGDAEKAPYRVHSEIELVEPMGSDTVGWAKLGGQSIKFRTSSDNHLATGQKITLGFDPARGSVFDSASGARL
jgi:multiple sugar transport system ATP-binding protein